uniref:Elongator complex protein 6 n=1 Tax=Chlorocebus sabaeus TaxID=60711 RepID=A0A0D9RTY4_CHLSB
MFVELNNLLNTTPDRAEQGKLTVLCDAKTDGSFLVHHFLSFYLKANCKVCFVALFQSFSHYNIVGQKLVLSFPSFAEKGELPVLDIRAGAQGEQSGSAAIRINGVGHWKTLGILCVNEQLRPDVIHSPWPLKELGLQHLSAPGPISLTCYFYCGIWYTVSIQGNMVMLVHDSGDVEDEENDILLNGVSHQSHLILRAEGLATGFCRDVHGQLRILWRRSSQPTAQRDQSLTYQYKIQDKSVSFFAKGMSPAVL